MGNSPPMAQFCLYLYQRSQELQLKVSKCLFPSKPLYDSSYSCHISIEISLWFLISHPKFNSEFQKTPIFITRSEKIGEVLEWPAASPRSKKVTVSNRRAGCEGQNSLQVAPTFGSIFNFDRLCEYGRWFACLVVADLRPKTAGMRSVTPVTKSSAKTAVEKVWMEGKIHSFKKSIPAWPGLQPEFT